MENFKIDDLSVENVDKAVQVFAKAMNSSIDAEKNMKTMIKSFYQFKNFIGIGLFKESSLVGFGSLIRMQSNTAWIPYVGVHPEYQGLGGGNLIMQKLLDIAHQRQWHTVELVASKAGFPLYQKFGFRTDYQVANFEIKTIYHTGDLESLTITDIRPQDPIPDWLLQFDKENVGVDRSNIFQVHNLDKITLIFKENHAYGFIYRQRLGPIISDSLETARAIICKGFLLGASLIVLPLRTNFLDFFKEHIELKMIPESEGTKMTFGDPIKPNLDHLISLRSMAYG